MIQECDDFSELGQCGTNMSVACKCYCAEVHCGTLWTSELMVILSDTDNQSGNQDTLLDDDKKYRDAIIPLTSCGGTL